MHSQAVLFDLDGTLLDSLADIGESMNSVLSAMGFAAHPLGDYRAFVGDGVTVLARRALPEPRRDEDTVAQCVARMRDVYRRRLAVHTKPYDGIAEMLDALEARGMPKAVLSNKPHDLTVELVKSVLGKWTFDPVFGERPETARKPDPAGALEVARRLAVPPPAILYIGDTPTDMRTAIAAGMRAVGAAWGFRSAPELRAAGATAIVHTPFEILAQLE